MILADKIVEERKRNGWSQEELAEKLNVSRQSVSKWEGAQSIPDLNRIIRMAELFQVSTDYLLKETEERTVISDNFSETSDNSLPIRKVSMKEASSFLHLTKKRSTFVALGVSLCIISPVPLLVLYDFAESGLFGISDNLARGLGILSLFTLITMAVFTFIKSGKEAANYEFLEKEEIDTEYGVDGIVREKRNAYEGTYNRFNTFGVILCITSFFPLLLTEFTMDKDYMMGSMVGLLLIIVAVAVYMFVKVGMIKGSYDKLLQEGSYTMAKKKVAPILGKIAGIYWLTVQALFLAISFITGSWGSTWIIWPVAGVMYAVVNEITKIVIKAED